MKVAFVVNARQKEKWVYRACRGALMQTHPCEIIFSDQGSTDGTVAEMERAVREVPRGADHHARVVHCPIEGSYGMLAMNQHMDWLIQQTDADWIFQSSADDYSLPDRVKACVAAIQANPCSAVATLMHQAEPDHDTLPEFTPGQSGMVAPGAGLLNLVYGSTIGGYSREFLLRVGSAKDVTPDVYWGFLAALDKGFYVVGEAHHVHVNHADLQNTGFQGKLRGAAEDELPVLNELNHFQLLSLYDACYTRAIELHPTGIPQEAFDALMHMIYAQAKAWLERRKELHAKGLTPGVLP